MTVPTNQPEEEEMIVHVTIVARPDISHPLVRNHPPEGTAVDVEEEEI